MIDLNLDGNAAPETPKLSVDVTIENFSDEIIQPSQSQLVVVEFWSKQSNASQQLATSLEKAVQATNGAAKLAKIDIAGNQQIAQQMRVQSVPAVYAFWQGQPVDGFMGAIPEQQLNTWLTKLIQTTGAKGPVDPKKAIERALKQAESLLNDGDITTAQSIYEDLASEFPEEPNVIAGCLHCMVRQNLFDDAKKLLSNLPDKLKLNNKVQSAIAALDLAESTSEKEATIEEWTEQIEKDPNNHDVRFDIAMYLYSKGDTEDAITQLLEIVARDRQWNKDGARLQILKIFEALGPTHEHTIEGRRKLSTILFS